MRGILSILIMGFVIWAVWYQVKSNNFPELADYLKNIRSSFTQLTEEVPDSFTDIFNPLKEVVTNTNLNVDSLTNVTNFGSVNLNSLTNLVNIGTTPAPTKTQQPIASKGNTGLSKIDPTKTVTTSTTTESGTITASGTVTYTNVERSKNGMPALSRSSKLDASALVKAKDIIARQYFEHVAPDGKTVSNLAGAQGYVYIKIGENLALGNFKDDADLVTAWMNSPGHRANILDSTYTEIGVGITTGTYQGRTVTVAVQHFGRPRSDCPTVNESLKDQVALGQEGLDTLAASLNALKIEIDQGTAQGQNVNEKIIIYNNGVDKYNSEYAALEAKRLQYNNQVNAFNTCVAGS